ncbi:hypothetical protein OOZ19_05030 [Saccharopolyspora sp. NFXS83]|uniref:DUF6801 domain-containing protein n=1 Tax=Saccharopolyspora sp. NFXS83 TaxID=2993560 RepID=UPI00224B1755|nr:DUF6801 domain-containing protein [Saccharopolyspora sp. NFXS83]MCX2729592.1 hypothetical protein [Saccharopolyspora sp. NFXS83]
MWTGRERARAAAGSCACAVLFTLVHAFTAEAGPVHRELSYRCVAPDGSVHPVSAQFDGRFPDTAALDEPVDVEGVSLRVTLPAEAAATWRENGATELAGTTALDLISGAGGEVVAAAESTAGAVPIPESGEVVVVTEQRDVSLPPPGPGPVRYAAGDLRLRLTAGTPQRPGAPAQWRCDPASGETAELLSLPVSPEATPEPAPEPDPADPMAPPQPPAEPIRITYDVTGASRTRALNSDIKLGPGTMVANVDVLSGELAGELTLPPVPGYFTIFGFMPSTATVEFLPVGPVVGTIELGKVEVTADVDIRLRDTTIGDVALAAGTDCRTARPASLHLISDPNFNPLVGGTLSAVFTIPEFRGCGAGEPLDPLFTGLVSGPGNTAQVYLQVRL